MNSKRVFFIMCGVLAVAFALLIGAVVLGDKLLQKKSDDLMALKLENRVLDEQQVSLIQANKDVQKYAELEKIAKSIVPQDKDQAKTVREIIRIAEANKIPISSITFPSSNLGQTAPIAAQGASGSGTATPTPAPKAPAITQVKPTEGLTGVYQMEITIQSEPTQPIPYNSLVNFLSDLEKNRRTAQVGGISIRPSVTRDKLNFSLTINVFIKP